jgi:hypothetical protein
VRQEGEAAETELGEARREAVAAIEGQLREALRSMTASWQPEDCLIEMVGPERTHWSEQGPWCPPGRFIVQMNFDTRGWNKEMFVKNVLCCPLSVAVRGENPSLVATGDHRD